MFKLICVAMLCLLAGCADMPPPRQSGGCIPGNPSGPPACQQATYIARAVN